MAGKCRFQQTKVGVSCHESLRAWEAWKRAVVAALIVGKITLQTSPDLPEGEEGLAVRDGRERHRYWRLQRGGRCGASVSTNVPNRDLRPKVTSTSTRLTAA